MEILPSFLLAFEDQDFLHREELRGVRFMLEYQKTEIALRDYGIRSTIVIFGSARTLSYEDSMVLKEQAKSVEDHKKADIAIKSSKWYEHAREFSKIASMNGGALNKFHHLDSVIATGGGPGIMEAANRGAHDANAPNIGFNIKLPFEATHNIYSTKELTFQFNYFALRKMHLAMRATALVAFPGGFGTLDEVFEILTLISCKKMGKVPIVLYDEEYWKSIINFNALLENGMISESDLDLFHYANTPNDAWETLVKNGLEARISKFPENNHPVSV